MVASIPQAAGAIPAEPPSSPAKEETPVFVVNIENLNIITPPEETQAKAAVAPAPQGPPGPTNNNEVVKFEKFDLCKDNEDAKKNGHINFGGY